MHRRDLDALRAVAPHAELETTLAPPAREVRVRGRAALVRLARPACDRCPDLVAINASAGALPVEHRGPPPLDSLRACRLALTLTNLAEAKQHLEVALAREPDNRLFRRLADRLERRR